MHYQFLNERTVVPRESADSAIYLCTRVVLRQVPDNDREYCPRDIEEYVVETCPSFETLKDTEVKAPTPFYTVELRGPKEGEQHGHFSPICNVKSLPAESTLASLSRAMQIHCAALESLRDGNIPQLETIAAKFR